jgi:hypothetical protein
MQYTYTNQKQIRQAFWESFPHFEEQAREAGIFTKSQNHHCATVRCAFVDFVDYLSKDGQISEKLANRVTL